MGLFQKLFGSSPGAKSPQKNSRDSSRPRSTHGTTESFPSNLLGKVSMVVINYEGPKDRDLHGKIVQRLMPLARSGCGFLPYCNATVLSLAADEPDCGMIRVDGGMPKPGVSLDSYMACIASKDSFPVGSPGYGRDYPASQIGYWIGRQGGTKVHAILLI